MLLRQLSCFVDMLLAAGTWRAAVGCSVAFVYDVLVMGELCVNGKPCFDVSGQQRLQ
jgi:hypothetical protein